MKLIVPFDTIDRLRKLAETLYQRSEIKDAYLLASAIADIVHATGKPGLYAATPVGVCPCCGDYDELLKIGRKNYAVCHEHRVYWYIGTNHLLSDDDADEFLRQNRNLLRLYTQVPITEAFPKAVCLCCGLFIEHAPWCITPLTKQDEAL
jgi:hypothetical protein